MLAISIRNQHKMPAIPVYGICNEHELISGCVTGKIHVIFGNWKTWAYSSHDNLYFKQYNSFLQLMEFLYNLPQNRLSAD